MAQKNAIAADPMTIAQDWHLPDRGSIGIMMLIFTESVLFLMFVVAYVVYNGQSITGPYPKDVLDIPILATICLLSSSLTIVLAENALKKGHMANFRLWWLATIALGLGVPHGHGRGMAASHRGRTPDDHHESVWHHLLFARRSARHARGGRHDFPASCYGGNAAGPQRRQAGTAREVPFLVLAFCRRRVGCGVHGCLRHRKVNAKMEQDIQYGEAGERSDLHTDSDARAYAVAPGFWHSA